MFDVTFDANGLTVLLRSPKPEQNGEVRKVGLSYGSNLQICPVRSLQDWLRASGLSEEVLYRFMKMVYLFDNRVV